MRIALLGMAHETNTFSRVPATYQEFQQTGFVRGQGLVVEYRDSFHTNAGFLQAEDELGCQVVPLLYTHAGPIGTITSDAFDRIVGEMLQLLHDHGHLGYNGAQINIADMLPEKYFSPHPLVRNFATRKLETAGHI